MGNWWGVIAPKGVPKDRMEVLDRAFAKAVKSPQYLELMRNNKMGSDFVGSAQFSKFYQQDADVVIKLHENHRSISQSRHSGERRIQG